MGKNKLVNFPSEKFCYDVAYARTLSEGEGRESGVSLSGRGVCCKSCDAFVQPAFFHGGKSRKKWRGPRHRVQKLVYFRNFFSSILSIRICECSVSSKLFRKNCYGSKQ